MEEKIYITKYNLLDKEQNNKADEYPIFFSLTDNYPWVKEKIEFLKEKSSEYRANKEI